MRNILLAASKADVGKTTIAAAICQILADARQLQNVRVIELESEKRLERRIAGPVEHHAPAEAGQSPNPATKIKR
jgi:hypothetical protein